MATTSNKFLLALHYFPKFGPVRMKKLLQGFAHPEEAFRASAKSLINAGIEEHITNEFIAMRAEIDPDRILEKMIAEEIEFITLGHADYPPLLAEIYDPPALLFYRGKIDIEQKFSLAVVGTRKYTAYGKQVTAGIVADLARRGLTIVSGLALGVDSLAHETTLENNGRTIAVLGTGLDKQSLYPSSNRYLADKIVKSGGLIISEFPLGTPPLKPNFPRRNRIISGMSLGTLVIEAGERSGALITARFALEQNREVFAVPGSIYSPYSLGPNSLIKQGAKPVSSGQDIIEALDLASLSVYIENKKNLPDTKEEEAVLANLTKEPRHIDEIIRLTAMNAAIVNSTLVIMEMKGMVKNLGNMEYVLAN